jgi:hypothetical protein
MGRAIVGPYGLMLWNYTSGIDGRAYFSATLMENGKVIFRTANAEVSEVETYGVMSLVTTGAVHLSAAPGTARPSPESRHSGYRIDLVSPETSEHWSFDLEFTATTFWFPASGTQSVGQYVGKISGGLKGENQYDGQASGSVMELTT